jgi:hypothetical protein
MIGISVPTKKALKAYIGHSIAHLIIETSMFGPEYSDNVEKLPYVCPSPYKRKAFGQITVVNGILTKCS